MLHTRLCDLLGINHPILNAPMGGTAVGALAAAVSNAGGLGMIGGTSGEGPQWLRTQIRTAREKTDRPFGVGFISAFPGIDDLVQVALDEQVAVINHSFADPTPYVAAAKARGVRIFAQVQSVAQAQRAAQAGVDAIIAQGTEAGGHTGVAGTLALVPAVVDAVGDIPVLAAGGIADGRGLAAVGALGNRKRYWRPVLTTRSAPRSMTRCVARLSPPALPTASCATDLTAPGTGGRQRLTPNALISNGN